MPLLIIFRPKSPGVAFFVNLDTSFSPSRVIVVEASGEDSVEAWGLRQQFGHGPGWRNGCYHCRLESVLYAGRVEGIIRHHETLTNTLPQDCRRQPKTMCEDDRAR
jgi:hypothetical protein